ncbi:YciI family protein [Microbacterium immunditiarum]|uniref:Uncharacterized protein YciI n=1 Tax=Microbacterium immunditiarum TaxID=337480 RepID=A0A7Y9GPJ9_9MICO|nr:YciI family protein [Microbacterium immunditiarum]NYE20172.1 uncharacterized protein YciI [Microbacterium immunditiarum]
MQWLYRIVPSRPEMPGAPTREEAALASEHFDYLLELKERGALVLAGRTQEDVGTFGIVIFEAPDRASARAIAEADPAVAGGVFTMTLHPYAVAVARDELGD